MRHHHNNFNYFLNFERVGLNKTLFDETVLIMIWSLKKHIFVKIPCKLWNPFKMPSFCILPVGRLVPITRMIMKSSFEKKTTWEYRSYNMKHLPSSSHLGKWISNIENLFIIFPILKSFFIRKRLVFPIKKYLNWK